VNTLQYLIVAVVVVIVVVTPCTH